MILLCKDDKHLEPDYKQVSAQSVHIMKGRLFSLKSDSGNTFKSISC